MTGLMGGIYRISEWIMRLAYLNLLWICFTLAGLVVFGVFPATAAIFVVNRKWMMGELDIPVFKTFWSAYKTEFLKSNLLGLILVVLGFMLYIDYRFFMETQYAVLQMLYFPFLAFICLYSLLLLYAFPVFVHYEMKIFQVLKNALLVMILNPLPTIMMVMGNIIVYYTMISFPGLIPFFGISIFAFVITWSAHYAFAKNQRYIEVLQNE
ncbi:YesL family protein [Ammoniphilus sp. 3BR4]|uniref:YesL family protein n=1 Tax=Ammoniphilus sp. 3BR4 TaxID=3158265 RepID=UPI0034657795